MTRPLACARGVFRTNFSYAHTACWVPEPNEPVDRARGEAEVGQPLLHLLDVVAGVALADGVAEVGLDDRRVGVDDDRRSGDDRRCRDRRPAHGRLQRWSALVAPPRPEMPAKITTARTPAPATTGIQRPIGAGAPARRRRGGAGAV